MKLKPIFARFPILLVGCLSALFSFRTLHADIIQVGAGSYTTTLPSGRLPPVNSHNNPVMPKITSTFSGPPQTNDWWSSLIWSFNVGNNWSENLFAHPLSFRAQPTGLEVGYPVNHYVTGFNPTPKGWKAQEYHYPHVRDMLVSVVGLSAPDTRVSTYSDWAVTASWQGNGRSMQTTIGKGIPFTYVTKAGGDALIAFNGTPTIWSNSNGVVGMTVNGRHYGIFGPAGSAWTSGGNNLQSNLNGKDYFSIGLLPDNQPATLEFFRKRAYAFVTHTQVSWNYDQSTSTLTTVFKTQTVLKEPGPNNSNVNNPLMALYRHQWLNSTDPFLPFTYASARGTMKVVDGSQFTTKLKYNGVLPHLPLVAVNGSDSYSANQLYSYVDAIYRQSRAERWRNINPGTDTYWSGKFLERIANLIPIADQVKHTAARDLFLAELKDEMQKWLKVNSSKGFYYDNNWDTLIGYPASYGSETQLNDHQFHWGYFIYAGAIIAQYDAAWAQDSQWGGMINLLIKDAANPDRNDKMFPFLRNFDVYSGHSWANGPAAFAAGNNEESSSEDFNFATAVILWGAMTNNQTLRDTGIYLYSTLVSSVPQYWFDVDNVVFPPAFQPNTLGIVWGDGGAYAVWFDAVTDQVHGINFLPINTGMLYLGHFPNYLRENQTFMMNNAGTGTVWRDIHLAVRALYDPLGAINTFNSNPNYEEEPGESRAHTYYWLHNINKLGRVDPSITANTPLYRVFNNNGKRTYIAYNTTTAPITVQFSDGVQLAVPARSIATSHDTPLPPQHQYTTESNNLGEVQFAFKPNWEPEFVNFNYKLNGGSLQKTAMVKQNGIWTYTIHNLKNGDVIDYYYSYEDNGVVVKTAQSQHIYRCVAAHIGLQASVESPPYSSPLVTVNNLGYKEGIERTGEHEIRIWFDPIHDSPQFVDVHYMLDDETQQSSRMMQRGNRWESIIYDSQDSRLINYSFSYELDGSIVSTEWQERSLETIEIQ
jgi:endoglucanase Acf2